MYETRITDPADAGDHSDELQFISHEEGRARPLKLIPEDVASPGPAQQTLAWDYYIKDHLGNVRTVLTDEIKVDKYPACSLESDPGKQAWESLFYNIVSDQVVANPVSLPGNYTNDDNGIGYMPADAVFEAAQSAWLYKLNGSSESTKSGLGITIKVMAGDKIDIFGKSYYPSANSGTSSANSAITLLTILNGFLGATGGIAANSLHGTVTEPDINTPDGIGLINTVIASQNTGTDPISVVPKAYINYLFFDENFTCTGGGFSKVSDIANEYKQHHSELQDLIVPKNGFVYIYCSNESPVDVFFDNLQVVHTRGPLVEENSYYPFGLKMAGISSQASGALVNKDKTFQGQKFDDDLGIDYVEFKYRNHDPQIGRFIEIDPLSDKYVHNSTYAFSENKVTTHVELEGLESIYIFGKAKQELANMFQGAANWIDNAFSAGSKTTVETPLTTSSGSSSNTLTLESTTSASTNMGPFMSFIIQNNTSNGYTDDYFKTTTTTTVSAGTKIEIKTPVASGSLNASTDQSGKTTVSGTGSVKTGSLNVGVNTSTSSDGTQKIGGNVSVSSGSTTGKAGVTIGNNSKISSVEASISAEQIISNTKVMETLFFRIGW